CFADLPDSDSDHMLGDYTGAATIFGATGGVMEAALRTAYHLVTNKELPENAVEFQNVRGLDGVRETSVEIAGTTIKLAVAHGLGNVGMVLDKIRAAKEAGEPMPYDFIEVMACPGGCVG